MSDKRCPWCAAPERVTMCDVLFFSCSSTTLLQSTRCKLRCAERRIAELEEYAQHTVAAIPAQADKVPELSGVAAELADCVIRILDYCAGRGINLGEAIGKKMAYNEGRERLHGKKF